MPLSSDGKEVTLGESVSFIDFPELVNAHLDWCRDTRLEHGLPAARKIQIEAALAV